MWRLIRVTTLSVLFFFATSAVSQDKTDQRATFSTYINSIAKTTYSLAWPSATYRSWSLEGIRPIDHGVEVTFQLLGTSYFGGDLWLNLAMDFSNGQFQQFRIVSHNAQLMEPFATSKLVAGATAYFASQYAAQTSPRAQAQSPPVTTTPQQPAPAPEPAPSSPQALAGPQETERVEAICINNSTDSVVSFAYSVGQWKEVSINPGYSIVITVKTPASENAVGGDRCVVPRWTQAKLARAELQPSGWAGSKLARV